MELNKERSNIYILKHHIKTNSFIEEKVMNYLGVIFKTKDITLPAEESKYEISKLKYRCINHIRSENHDELKKAMDLYQELIQALYDYMVKYGGGFSKSQAEMERTAFITDRLEALEWVSDDISEIFEEGLNSERKDIIRTVAHFPIKLARTAISNGDHLVFQNYIHYPWYMYLQSKKYKISNSNLYDFIIDRSWRYLKELSHFYLERIYEDGELDSENLKDYSHYIIKTFQRLIKQSYDDHDIKLFKTYIEKEFSLFDSLRDDYIYYEDDDSIANQLNVLKQESTFGLGAWIASQYETDQVDIVIECQSVIVNFIPHDFADLSKLFASVCNFEKERYWGWDEWERVRTDETAVYSIDIIGKLEKYFVFNALRILSSLNQNSIDQLRLPCNTDLSYTYKRLIDITLAIKNGEIKYDFTEKMVEKCDSLVYLLNQAINEQEKNELKLRIETSISKEKVVEFKSNVLENKVSSYGIFSILEFYNKLSRKVYSETEDQKSQFGINTFFNKAAFLPDHIEPNVHYTDIDKGFGFGRSMVNGENITIISKVRSNTEIMDYKALNNINLDELSMKNPIILSINRGFYKHTRHLPSEKYTPKWKLDNDKRSSKFYSNLLDGLFTIEGVDIPVYEIHDSSSIRDTLLIDVDSIGDLTVYLPQESNGINSSDIVDHLTVEVIELTEESDKTKSILNDPPNWLAEYGDREAQKEHILDSVIIKIFEKFEFNISNRLKGYRVE